MSDNALVCPRCRGTWTNHEAFAAHIQVGSAECEPAHGVGLHASALGLTNQQLVDLCNKLNDALKDVSQAHGVRLCGDMMMGLCQGLELKRPQVKDLLVALLNTYYGPEPEVRRHQNHARPMRRRQ